MDTVINGGFGVWESGFMSVFKFGQRYGLFGCRQAAELTPLAKHVRHAAFQQRQQLAATAHPNNYDRRRSNTLNHKALKLEQGVSRESSVNRVVENGDLHKGLPPEGLPQSIRETASRCARMSTDVARPVCSFF